MNDDNSNLSTPASNASGAQTPQILSQPESSRISIVETSNSAMIIIPADGFTGIAFRYTCFGCLSILLCGGFVTLLILLLFQIISFQGAFEKLGGVPMMGLCSALILLGAWLIVWANHLARRKTILTVTNTDLILTRASFLKKEESSTPIAKISSIRCVKCPDGFDANRDLLLQVLVDDENAIELFPGRDRAELFWLAQELKRITSKPT